MELRLSFRDLEPADLSDLDWSGGPEHIRAVAAGLELGSPLLYGHCPLEKPLSPNDIPRQVTYTDTICLRDVEQLAADMWSLMIAA